MKRFSLFVAVIAAVFLCTACAGDEINYSDSYHSETDCSYYKEVVSGTTAQRIYYQLEYYNAYPWARTESVESYISYDMIESVGAFDMCSVRLCTDDESRNFYSYILIDESGYRFFFEASPLDGSAEDPVLAQVSNRQDMRTNSSADNAYVIVNHIYYKYLFFQLDKN